MLGVLVDTVLGFGAVRLAIGAALLYRAATVTPDGLESAIVLAATAVAGALVVATAAVVTPTVSVTTK